MIKDTGIRAMKAATAQGVERQEPPRELVSDSAGCFPFLQCPSFLPSHQNPPPLLLNQ